MTTITYLIRRVRLLVLVSTAGVIFVGIVGLGQGGSPSSSKQRARLPQFRLDDSSQPFFTDLFSQLRGPRPAGRSSPDAKVDSVSTPGLSPTDAVGTPAGSAWPALISATTLADEIEALKIAIDKNVTTPSDFAGRGVKLVRRDFSILATLFAVVAEYDGDVRFKHSAAIARDRFARAAANARAAGSTNVYNEAKQRRRDLQDLLGGSRLSGEPSRVDWERVAARSALMQRLKVGLRERLVVGTRDGSEFSRRQEILLHEAEIVAAIAEVLTQEGMEDGDDEEYAALSRRMQAAAVDLVGAVKMTAPERARLAVGQVSQACADCHELYR